MSVLKMMFAKNAPTHHAEKWWPKHDGSLNLVEARRGRGKSFGAVKIMLEWFKERWADITNGKAPHARVLSNIRFDLVHVGYALRRMKVGRDLVEVLAVLRERVIYIEHWDQVLTAYDSLIMIDEANRNLDVYDVSKASQSFMPVVHDWLQQTRKHVLTLWFFVQDVEWIKSQVRSLMDKLWRAKRVRKKGTMLVRYFPWYGSDPWAKGKGKELNRSADFKMRFDFELWTARCYDTLQAVETLSQETQFHNFGEISDYMLKNGLKPVKQRERRQTMTWAEEQEWLAANPRASFVSPRVPPELAMGGAGGAAGAAYVAPPRGDAAHESDALPPRKRVHRVAKSA